MLNPGRRDDTTIGRKDEVASSPSTPRRCIATVSSILSDDWRSLYRRVRVKGILAHPAPFDTPFTLSVLCSIIRLQTHAFVEIRYLFTVAIERQRLASFQFANAAFGALGPAGMIDIRVDVGVKTVLVRGRRHPQ